LPRLLTNTVPSPILYNILFDFDFDSWYIYIYIYANTNNFPIAFVWHVCTWCHLNNLILKMNPSPNNYSSIYIGIHWLIITNGRIGQYSEINFFFFSFQKKTTSWSLSVLAKNLDSHPQVNTLYNSPFKSGLKDDTFLC